MREEGVGGGRRKRRMERENWGESRQRRKCRRVRSDKERGSDIVKIVGRGTKGGGKGVKKKQRGRIKEVAKENTPLSER